MTGMRRHMGIDALTLVGDAKAAGNRSADNCVVLVRVNDRQLQACLRKAIAET
ncbi:hypothetical protein C2845_PM01G43520 [Panicum miliaceum]|uniref:Uncharacterized protein n=1 Tax=Panicum miliaceum TaxID=4540 RepID=A0A3L6TNA9_PANMI|nr:hypothetical protein C2845_PM01G43520 [Panicum miliaceum]